MKLVTKMKRFVGKMEQVENMTERQLVEMLFRAEKLMAEYIEAEDRKDAAYDRVKENSKYWSGRGAVKRQAIESVEDDATSKVAATTQSDEELQENDKEVADLNISQQVLNQGRLVITKDSEEKGLVIGAYHKGGDITYFTSSNSFDNPVVFGNPALTAEIKDRILEQKPDFYQAVTKDFKSIALFGKSGNQNAMVYLANAKRLVFEGYIGDMVFSTTKEYIDKGYSPLVTRADIFIANGGKHNHVTNNMCSPAIKKFITSLIQQYIISAKFSKASKDVEYFNRLKRSRQSEDNVTTVPEPQPQTANLGYGLDDIYKAMMASEQSSGTLDGGIEYEPEF